jgi:hypothetical protein
MHEPFDPQCGYCARFVYCFAPESPLSDWGFCACEAGDSPPGAAELRRLEELAAAGRYDLLFAAARGLYQVGDDGCSRYQPAVEGMPVRPAWPAGRQAGMTAPPAPGRGT